MGLQRVGHDWELLHKSYLGGNSGEAGDRVAAWIQVAGSQPEPTVFHDSGKEFWIYQ